jgi:hypothetical protein
VFREITNMADDEQHGTAQEKPFDDRHGFGESQLSASKNE